MEPPSGDLWRVLGAAARLWANPSLLEVRDEYWTAFSGARNVNYNLSCCTSPRPEVLADACYEPTMRLKRPAIIMLAGPGLATAQGLAANGWVTVGALPLMVLDTWEPTTEGAGDVRRLSLKDLPQARELLADNYGLDEATAAAAIPVHAVDDSDMAVWGNFCDGQLVSCVTTVVQDGLVVIWSMATRAELQGRGHGRQLLETALTRHVGDGATGSLLHSSVAGETLYRELGFTVVEYLQLWSRPRWVLGAG